jgi:type IV pilus assembly protein PilW
MDKTAMLTVRRHHVSAGHPLQQGLSLVELLVAMAVGLLLTAGVLTIFVNSRQTYRVQDNLAHLQESGRFALVLLGNALRMAGFKTDPENKSTSVFPKGAVCINPTAPFAVLCTETTGSPDPIAISFQGAADGTTRDCLGNAVPASQPFVNEFFIASNNLNCRSTNTATGSSLTQNLVENVEDIQVTYGVDSDGSRSPNYYAHASPGLDWSQVVSLRICLLLRTQEANLTTTAQAVQCPGGLTPATDGRLRQVFSTTMALRNLLP